MNSRTLSGADEGDFTILNLKNIKDAIRIEGNSGVKGQVLQKSSTNKLNWGFVDDIEIPDGSIEGDKLAPNINISTTGNITASTITATSHFNQTDVNGINTFSGVIRCPKLTTNNQGIDVLNGGVIKMYSDGGSAVNTQIELNGTNGNITSFGGMTSLYNTIINNSLVAEGNGIFTTDIKGSSNANSPYTYTLDGSTGDISCNELTCDDLNINNHTGTIEFNQVDTSLLKVDSIELPKTGAVESRFDSGGIALTGATKNITLDGDITCGGDYTSTSGNVDLVNGNLFLDNGVAFIGNIGGGNHRITLNGANGRIDCETINNAGNYTSTAGNITLTTGDLTIGGDTTTEDITMNG